MKRKTLMYFIVALCAPAISQANPPTSSDLASVTVFSFGANGFIAKKMPPQIIYKNILKNKNSTNLFENIMHDTGSTPEAKAYAACGLWENKKRKGIYLDKKFHDLPITILQGDILRKEKLGEVIFKIKLHGCK